MLAATQSVRFSARSCRTSLARPAPRAARTASSPRRRVARAASSPPALAQAIASSDEHRPEAKPDPAAGAGADDVIEQRDDPDVEVPVDEVLVPQPPRDHRHLGAGVVDSDAGPQPAEDFEADRRREPRAGSAIAASPRAAATSASPASAVETTWA